MFFPYSPFRYNNYYRPFYHSYSQNTESFQNIIDTNTTNQDIQGNDVQRDIKGQETKNNESQNRENQKRSTKYNSFANINLSALLESDLNTPVIEILGIKLYLDDLIIIGLLFFLYKEEVHDEILFSVLLLLLLS